MDVLLGILVMGVLVANQLLQVHLILTVLKLFVKEV